MRGSADRAYQDPARHASAGVPSQVVCSGPDDARVVRRLPACPVCGSGDFQPFALNAWSSGALHFAQVRCKNCGLLISQPQVSDIGACEYYSHSYYEELWPDADALWAQNTRDHSTYELPLMRKLWADWPPPAGGRAIEIGCGYGAVMHLLSRAGYRVVGSEISRRAALYCRHRALNVVQGSVPGAPFPKAWFDIVLSLQVIEHVHDPRAFLDELVSLARPGGIVVIATEDAVNSQYVWERVRAHLTGRIPRFRSSTDHTFVFAAGHLQALMADAGCDDVRTASFSCVPDESFHWRLYKGAFRALDRITGHGDFLMAVGRRRPTGAPGPGGRC
jgi:2-polyprenyl-3-methyl-5-hydroxy-6-metoxy-1,4-benzoquinol methylase